MYDAEFDTDWDDLDKEGALERAFALGVARSLGTPNHEEYERVRDAAETTSATSPSSFSTRSTICTSGTSTGTL